MNILVINAGSSSLKYQLLNPETGVLLAKGLCERIGIDGKFTYKPQIEGKKVLDAVDVAMPTHSEAIQAVLNALVDADNGVIGSMKEIDAVGHRVVHGGCPCRWVRVQVPPTAYDEDRRFERESPIFSSRFLFGEYGPVTGRRKRGDGCPAPRAGYSR